nr:SMP-30/gluconolactonase/LRE family protein [Paracoccus sp. S-4012]
MRIGADGSQSLIAQVQDDSFAAAEDETDRFTPTTTLPNGLAFDRDGSFLISNFGTDRLERMSHDGSRTEVLLDRINGQPVGKVNFVLRDRRGRIWITVSTRIRNWMSAISQNVADGYVAVLDERGARIVADSFAFTNEIRFDAEERWLYVVETSGRRITRLRIGENAKVEAREICGITAARCVSPAESCKKHPPRSGHPSLVPMRHRQARRSRGERTSRLPQTET